MHVNRLFLLYLLPGREAYRLAFKECQRLFNPMPNEVGAAASVPVYQGKTASAQVEVSASC